MKEVVILRSGLDDAANLVEDYSVADDDDDTRHMMSHERHRDHEPWIFVR